MRTLHALLATASLLCALLIARSLVADEPAKTPPAGKPPYERLLQGDEARQVGKQKRQLLATHGDVDDRFPLRSALILYRDHLPDPARQLDTGLPIYDGRLTAEKVLRQWHL